MSTVKNSVHFYETLHASRKALQDRIDYCEMRLTNKYADNDTKRYWRNNLALAKNAFNAIDLIFNMEY